MKKQSAGLLLYRKTGLAFEVLIVHPGGPFWAKRDAGAWSIPKGEFEAGEDPMAAAKREFAEEIGSPAPAGTFMPLGSTVLASGKTIVAWALESDFEAKDIKSNMFTIEWPPKSGQKQDFPEVDRAGWFPIAIAAKKLHRGQLPLLDTLAQQLGRAPDTMSLNQQATLF